MALEDQRFVVARLGKTFLAFDIRAIKEVVALQEKIDQASLVQQKFLDISYREQQLKIVQPGQYLDLDLEIEPRRFGSAIVVESRGHRVGLYTDEVTCILKGAQLQVHNKLFNFSQSQRRSIQQIFEFKDREGQALLVDIDQFVQTFEEESWFVETQIVDPSGADTTQISLSENNNQNLFLRFDIGEHHFRVPIQQVERILPFGKLNRFASSPKHVLGLRHVEGNVIAVVDWLVKMKDESAHDPYRRILIFQLDGSWFGVGAHRVRDIVSKESLGEEPEWQELDLSLLEVEQVG